MICRKRQIIFLPRPVFIGGKLWYTETMKLSQRLRTVKELIPAGGVVADIGADRGELSLALLSEGIAEKVILTDVSPRSLNRAKQLFADRDEAAKAEFRVGNGLFVLSPGEADTAVFAGMGGLTIVDILTAAPAVTAACSCLVIQAMGNSDKVRRCLGSLGFALTDERMVEEEGQFYAILRAVPGASRLDETELFAGPFLLARKDPVLRKWLRLERDKAEAIRKKLAEKNEGLPRRRELAEKIRRIDEAEKRMNTEINVKKEGNP